MAIPVRRNRRLINSLARGVQVLRLLARNDGPLGVTDVAENLCVDPSTAYRLLATLDSEGLAQQDPDSKKYSIGIGVLEISSALLRRSHVVAAADSFLRAVTAETGESSHLAILDGDRAVFVDRKSGVGVLRVETSIGSSEPAYCTAVGKALLADLTELQLRQIFDGEPLHRYTPHTITTIAELAAELERARRTGYAFDEEELHPGVRCVAAPVRDSRGHIVAAFGISGPASRLTREHIPKLSQHVMTAAQDISLQLGYKPMPVVKSS